MKNNIKVKNENKILNKYKVYTHEDFDIEMEKFSKSELEQFEKIADELAEKGKSVGKPLGCNFLREKKIKGKRIYFLVYEEIVLVLVVALSNKKNQQETIDKIRDFLPEYKNYVYEKLI